MNELIFRKKVDKTFLKSNLFTVPKKSEEKLKSALGVTLKKGEEAIKIKLEIENFTFDGRLFIADSESNNALQIGFNKDLHEILAKYFVNSFNFITEELKKSPKVIIPDTIAEYINIVTTDNPKTIRIEKVNDLIQENNTNEFPSYYYTKKDALLDLFMTEEKFDKIHSILKSKKNIILQGSPGVGKTFVAKRLAFSFIGNKDESKVEMIQFHQSYSYEDFIQGYRPTEDGKFLLKEGIFYKFCKKAAEDIENPYFFIIDEINRGNLSKIFGELMMLIESDKRGSDYSISLTYSREDSERFSVPPNLYIIGTMNTADRSLAIVDYALRRRFAFIDIEPAFNTDKFKSFLIEKNIDETFTNFIIKKFKAINSNIEKDPRLGKGYKIGHSYFSSNEKIENFKEWYKEIIETEIEPLILEYWFDEEEKAKEQIENLLMGL
ncbi:MAG: AAA family ATPase [Candidatus Sericytochromatia bacterium]|nr:AAA family ATPase [Candidatus Sericytochromatia bacterium]